MNRPSGRPGPRGRASPARFDALHARFKADVPADDVRLLGRREGPGPARRAVVSSTSAAARGGSPSSWRRAGREVVGLDLSAAMLAGGRAGSTGSGARRGGCRSPTGRSTRSSPSRSSSTSPGGPRRVLAEAGAGAAGRAAGWRSSTRTPGRWNARRPWLPNLAVKWIDERRGRWMYPAGGPVRERWFWPGAFRRRLRRGVRRGPGRVPALARRGGRRGCSGACPRRGC